MRPITPASPEQGQAIANAVERLREARTLLRQAGARQAAAAAGKRSAAPKARPGMSRTGSGARARDARARATPWRGQAPCDQCLGF
jgi:hypothetical protein